LADRTGRTEDGDIFFPARHNAQGKENRKGKQEREFNIQNLEYRMGKEWLIAKNYEPRTTNERTLFHLPLKKNG
jgi:hypothetical protein